jgi:hypothetical protein
MSRARTNRLPGLPGRGTLWSATLLILLAALAGNGFAEESGVWEGQPLDEEASLPPDPEGFKRPKYAPVRYLEDWSGLADRDPSEKGDLYDPIKHVPLMDGDRLWAGFGGSVRGRWEVWHQFAFGSPPSPHDSYGLAQYRIHADVHATKFLRGFLEVKSAFATDRDLPGGERTLDVDELALQNGFVEGRVPIEGGSLSLRMGRQELLFGKQRLVSPLGWSNTRRAWDGFRFDFELQGWTATVFWTQFAPVDKFDFNEPDHRHRFYGVHGEGKLKDWATLNAYWLSQERGGPVFWNGTWGAETRHTLGARLAGTPPDGSLDFDVELAGQTGSVGDEAIEAWMFSGQAGYTLEGGFGKPRLWVGLDYASGDLQPGGDVETFNPLFPLGHAYLGYIDIIGRQNLAAFSAGAVVKPPIEGVKGVTVTATGHLFYRAHKNDSLYNAGGGIVRWGFGTSASRIGAEVDLVLKVQVDAHLLCMLGYSQFFPGRFIGDTGEARETRFGYAQVQYTF